MGPTFSHDKLSSLYTSIHPPEVEINPLKMACGCPWGGVIKNSPNMQTADVFTRMIWEYFVHINFQHTKIRRKKKEKKKKRGKKK